VISSLLKSFFRKLPEPLFTNGRLFVINWSLGIIVEQLSCIAHMICEKIQWNHPNCNKCPLSSFTEQGVVVIIDIKNESCKQNFCDGE